MGGQGGEEGSEVQVRVGCGRPCGQRVGASVGGLAAKQNQAKEPSCFWGTLRCIGAPPQPADNLKHISRAAGPCLPRAPLRRGSAPREVAARGLPVHRRGAVALVGRLLVDLLNRLGALSLAPRRPPAGGSRVCVLVGG